MTTKAKDLLYRAEQKTIEALPTAQGLIDRYEHLENVLVFAPSKGSMPMASGKGGIYFKQHSAPTGLQRYLMKVLFNLHYTHPRKEKETKQV